ncbi:MAG: hypothetical protein JWN52_1270 [Actinomycetia bacterium]|nr:hypothetical protein [Actinomycetes bacterium]
MRLTRLRRLGVVVTAGTLAAGAALAIAPSASASSDGCTRYGYAHKFCIKVDGTGRHVNSITVNTPYGNWNGYVVATVTGPNGKTLYKAKTHYKHHDYREVFQVKKTFPNHSKACVTGYGVDAPGKYHRFAKVCKEIHK